MQKIKNGERKKGFALQKIIMLENKHIILKEDQSN